jgi:hypothetical protein
MVSAFLNNTEPAANLEIAAFDRPTKILNWASTFRARESIENDSESCNHCIDHLSLGFNSSFPRKSGHSLRKRAVCSDQKSVLPSEESLSVADDLTERTVICVVVGCCLVAHGLALLR